MMRFVFGVAVGAAGYWAYEQGLLQGVLPFGASQNAFDQPGSEGDSQIIRPTPQEVSGRPAEPIPS